MHGYATLFVVFNLELYDAWGIVADFIPPRFRLAKSGVDGQRIDAPQGSIEIVSNVARQGRAMKSFGCAQGMDSLYRSIVASASRI
jgi:hypothetical protein